MHLLSCFITLISGLPRAEKGISINNKECTHLSSTTPDRRHNWGQPTFSFTGTKVMHLLFEHLNNTNFVFTKLKSDFQCGTE